MAQEMNKFIRTDHLSVIRQKYQKAEKPEKSKILDDFVTDSGMNRKSAIRILNIKGSCKRKRKKAGRKRKYDDQDLLEYIKRISSITNHICSKRLKPTLVVFIPFYEREYEILPEYVKELIRQISPRTLDRIFAAHLPKRLKKGLCTTKPGSIIRKRIPVKTEQWNETRPGFLEVDTVAHCGGSTMGMFVYTLNFVDIATSWTISRATWGKGQTGIFNAIIDVIDTLPFKIRGFDSDNGGEFMNERLYSYFKKRKKKVLQTRSREYMKNDNAHIESKNWSITRQYFGYERFDNFEIVDIMNDLYTNELYFFLNFFIPSTKLISKDRNGSKITKKYDVNKTPFERVIESPDITSKTKKELNSIYKKLNPIALHKEILKKIKMINALATPYVSVQKKT